MHKQSKTIMEKEQELLATIAGAKKKLEQLQLQQKLQLGTLACKHGLQHINPHVLEKAFQQLSVSLSHAQ